VGRVLVIDDEEALTDLIRVVLADAGHDVVVSNGPRDLPPGPFDCVLTDLVTLTGYSYDAARRWLVELSGGYPNAPIVVVTAHVEAREDRLRLGVRQVVMKPFDVDELAAAVSAAITS
jgi:CheY-like chemotaxis protein